MQLRRLIRHALAWSPRARVLTPTQSEQLSAQVKTMEAMHRAEVRICLERSWPLTWAASDVTVRERAMHWFAHEHVWDTEGNTGVLVYISLADHAIEIVADRGLNPYIQKHQWQSLTEHMRGAFAQANYFGGLQICLTQLQTLLNQQLPHTHASSNPNELSNRPMVR